MLFEIEQFAIVVVGLLMAYAEFRLGLLYPRKWLKFLLAFMGFYWAGFYTYQLIRDIFGWSFPAHQIFVRSGILFTLSLITANALMTLRELRGLKNDT